MTEQLEKVSQRDDDIAQLPEVLKWKTNLIIENSNLQALQNFHSRCVFTDLCFDPASCGPTLFISDENAYLRKNAGPDGWRTCRTMNDGWTQGIHYWSMRLIDRGPQGHVMIGIVPSNFDTSLALHPGQTADSYAFYVHNGTKYNGGPAAFTSDLPKNSDVIGVLLDLDARTLTYFKNGQILGTAYGQLLLQGTTIKYYPAVGLHQLGQWVSLIKTIK